MAPLLTSDLVGTPDALVTMTALCECLPANLPAVAGDLAASLKLATSP